MRAAPPLGVRPRRADFPGLDHRRHEQHGLHRRGAPGGEERRPRADVVERPRRRLVHDPFTPNGLKDYLNLTNGGDWLNNDPGLFCVSEPAQQLPCTPQAGDNDAFAGARSRHPGGINVCLGDGSVRFIKNTINHLIWIGVNSISGGEVISSRLVLSPLSSGDPPTDVAARGLDPGRTSFGGCRSRSPSRSRTRPGARSRSALRRAEESPLTALFLAGLGLVPRLLVREPLREVIRATHVSGSCP